MSETSAAIPLHLHTPQSICDDLISEVGVKVGETAVFRLESPAARSILNWYASRQAKWGSPVQAADLEDIVSATRTPPKQRPAAPRTGVPAGAPSLFKIKSLRVHRFAGTHAYGTPKVPPADLLLSFTSPFTLLEGGNGCGKTSIVNALTWCMTGFVLRPQRPPEEGTTEYTVSFEQVPGNGDVLTQQQTALVTPLPNPTVVVPSAGDKAVFADTWVEAEFEDASGKSYLVRRELRTDRGRLKEVVSDLSSFSLAPIAFRICTFMPALIPYIKLGSASDLGRAVAELTGLSSLTALAKHANKSSERVTKELRSTQEERIRNDNMQFDTARGDLSARYKELSSLQPDFTTPQASAATLKDVEALTAHFQKLKSNWLTAVQEVLGKEFNPSDDKDAADIERNIGPAFGQLDQLSKLKTSERLRSLGRLTDADIAAAESLILELREQAEAIAELATTKSHTRRHQLYARISGWLRDGSNDELQNATVDCVVCGRPLEGVLDPETGTSVAEHISDALNGKVDFVGQTANEWVRGAQGRLATELPEALRGELSQSLPDHPSDLIKGILLNELFDASCFEGKLSALRAKAEASFAAIAVRLNVPLEEKIDTWPTRSAHTLPVYEATKKLRRAIAFAHWRKFNVKAMQEVFEFVVGKANDQKVIEGEEKRSALLDHLTAIQSAVDGTAPLKAALALCVRLSNSITDREARVKRIEEIDLAASALAEIAQLGSLVERQIDELRSRLENQTGKWLRRIYQKTLSAGHELVGLDLSPTGQLGVLVGGGGVSAPAEQVANASALRATLLAFFFAFWEYVKQTRGGFDLLALDDPQELLDRENKERFATELPRLTREGTQLLVTTHDHDFARHVVLQVARDGGTIDHRAVKPVNAFCSHIRLPLSEEELDRKRREFERPDNLDEAIAAQTYAGEVRTYVEAGLAGLFDEPAYAKPIQDLGLSDLVGAIRKRNKEGSPFFVLPAVRQLCQSAEFAQGSAVLRLLNKSHHPEKQNLTYMHVKEVAKELQQACVLVRNVQEEFRRWRKREPLIPVLTESLSLVPSSHPFRDLPRLATLSAFAGSGSSGLRSGSSGDGGDDVLSGEWFVGKALLRLNTHNYGFSAPINSVVIVDAKPGNLVDRSLVVAGHGDKILARRLLLLPQDPSLVALAAEDANPRHRPPTFLLPASEVAAHRVVGVLLDPSFPPVVGCKSEAQPIGTELLELSKVEVAFRVKDDSALPLALPGQIVLGGAALSPNEFEKNVGQLIALALDDGRQLLKRIGPHLPASLSHIRQFESIGGYGESFIAAIEEVEGRLQEFPLILGARLVVGVLYHLPGDEQE